ncbi:MAG: hypothetical protein H0U76_23900 [Ktedonobacteraceae bacterium]|nr:hypothetical protein [Ktedonobacteraceae bacterium]
MTRARARVVCQSSIDGIPRRDHPLCVNRDQAVRSGGGLRTSLGSGERQPQGFVATRVPP